jgi:flagellar biosynthesis chaperone FliJ
MVIAPGLRRYLRVLVLEEEQTQAAFETVSAQVRALEQRLKAAANLERSGRQLIAVSAWSGEALDRIAALEQIATARRAISALRPILAEAIEVASRRRQTFLDKRVQRRQAETLVQEAEARAVVESSRRDQQSMDELHLDRIHRKSAAQETPSVTSSKS